jgi:hypothetical protein
MRCLASPRNPPCALVLSAPEGETSTLGIIFAPKIAELAADGFRRRRGAHAIQAEARKVKTVMPDRL